MRYEYFSDCMEILGDTKCTDPEFQDKLALIEEYLYARYLEFLILVKQDVEVARKISRERAKQECLGIEDRTRIKYDTI